MELFTVGSVIPPNAVPNPMLPSYQQAPFFNNWQTLCCCFAVKLAGTAHAGCSAGGATLTKMLNN
jgi:hypothetical protein